MIETKCKTCLGCERLAIPSFKEVYKCENYMEGVTKDDRNYMFSNSGFCTASNSDNTCYRQLQIK